MLRLTLSNHTIDTAAMLLKLLPVLHVVVLVGISLRIFSRRTAQGIAIAWLLLVILIPGVGALMYLLIGERRLGRVWMERASVLRPQLLQWAESIPSTKIALPTCLSSGGESVSRLAR